MNKTSTDIQKFIAGALAYIGFQALVGIAPTIIFTQSDVLTICLTVFPSVGLPIGLAMFVGKERAISWARSFLIIFVLISLGSAVVTRLSKSPALPNEVKNLVFSQSAFALFAPAILLGLLVWRHPKRLRNQPIAS